MRWNSHTRSFATLSQQTDGLNIAASVEAGGQTGGGHVKDRGE